MAGVEYLVAGPGIAAPEQRQQLVRAGAADDPRGVEPMLTADRLTLHVDLDDRGVGSDEAAVARRDDTGRVAVTVSIFGLMATPLNWMPLPPSTSSTPTVRSR